ncbi:hypothetical protein [Streptomyces europaeiscabiei]|uniref:hypothetical protein n=1 Tax=Streptomyces europaeiscabiei TaxID=146819 RepID=UPI0038F5EC39
MEELQEPSDTSPTRTERVHPDAPATPHRTRNGYGYGPHAPHRTAPHRTAPHRTAPGADAKTAQQAAGQTHDSVPLWAGAQDSLTHEELTAGFVAGDEVA